MLRHVTISDFVVLLFINSFVIIYDESYPVYQRIVTDTFHVIYLHVCALGTTFFWMETEQLIHI